MIIVITGASGVGKTTTLKALAERIPAEKSVHFFHIDELVQPNWDEIEDTSKWQEETTLELLTMIVKTARVKGGHVIFEGSIDIKYYLQGFRKNDYANYKIILFDCSPTVMQNRLIQRGQPELYHQDMINWLNYLRKDAKERKIKIIDTGNASIDEIGQELIKELDASLS
ncbi:MAG: AAA family ATPase [Bacteroidota bacterium]